MPGCNGTGTAEKSYPSPRSGAEAGRSYPTTEVRGGGREELPQAPMPKARGSCQEYQPMPKARGSGREDQPQGAVAAQAQVGLEELSHVEGQEGQQ